MPSELYGHLRQCIPRRSRGISIWENLPSSSLAGTVSSRRLETSKLVPSKGLGRAAKRPGRINNESRNLRGRPRTAPEYHDRRPSPQRFGASLRIWQLCAPSVCEVETYRFVHHLVSTVVGKLRRTKRRWIVARRVSGWFGDGGSGGAGHGNHCRAGTDCAVPIAAAWATSASTERWIRIF